MKKFVSAVVCLMMALSLCSCSNYSSYIKKSKEAQAKAEAEATPTSTMVVYDNYVEDTWETTAAADIEYSDSSSVTNKSNEKIDFQTFTYQYQDGQGYRYEATIKISPWIIESNESACNAAWNEVSQGYSYSKPTFKTMGLSAYADNLYMCNTKSATGSIIDDSFYATLTDMYFCYGTVAIKNITEGWDFTAENPRQTNMCLGWVSDSSSTITGKYSCIGKVFYSNTDRTNVGHILVEPKMTSNSWGPIPFVFAHGENFSPNYPDGQYKSEIENGYLGGTNLTIDFAPQIQIRIPMLGEAWEGMEDESVETDVVADINVPDIDETPAPAPSGTVDIDPDFGRFINSIYFGDTNNVREQIKNKFGYEMTLDRTMPADNLGYGDVMEWGVLDWIVEDFPESVNILGGTFSSVALKRNTVNGSDYIYGFELIDDSSDIATLENSFNNVYSTLVSLYGEPFRYGEDDISYGAENGAVAEWDGTELGDIWLCWGENMWGTEGHNDLYFSCTLDGVYVDD